MITVKTSDLTGVALDYVVAQIDGYEQKWLMKNISEIPAYSSNWALCGKLMDEHLKSMGCVVHLKKEPIYRAFARRKISDVDFCNLASGKDIKEAFLRALVIVSIGDEAQVPKSLQES